MYSAERKENTFRRIHSVEKKIIHVQENLEGRTYSVELREKGRGRKGKGRGGGKKKEGGRGGGRERGEE